LHGISFAGDSVSARIILPLHDAVSIPEGDAPGESATEPAAYSIDEGYQSERWGVDRIEAHRAWLTTTGHESTIVAVLDTGISRDSEFLAGRVVAEANFTDSPTSDDLYGHGTHMAGTIAAIAPDCLLMNVKVADDTGRSEASAVARGIIWAVDNGAQVINISLTMRASPELEQAISYAWDRGAVIVAAAGNQGASEPVYPAYYSDCLAVAGTNRRDSLALLSNYGYWVDLAAPGFNIYSDLPGNEYGYKTGTSAAAAHVSGVAALVFSVVGDGSGDDSLNHVVRRAIEDSCTPMANDGVGSGLVNAYQSVTTASATS